MSFWRSSSQLFLLTGATTRFLPHVLIHKLGVSAPQQSWEIISTSSFESKIIIIDDSSATIKVVFLFKKLKVVSNLTPYFSIIAQKI
jgi:hypothetical protein